MVGCHHQLNGHAFEQTLGENEGHGRLWRAAVHGIAKSQTDLATAQQAPCGPEIPPLTSPHPQHTHTQCLVNVE